MLTFNSLYRTVRGENKVLPAFFGNLIPATEQNYRISKIGNNFENI